jgi:hypothetical protein
MATLNSSWSTRVSDGITHLGFKSETNSVQDAEKPLHSPEQRAVWARHPTSPTSLIPPISVFTFTPDIADTPYSEPKLRLENNEEVYGTGKLSA